MENSRRLLEKRFGFSSFKPNQEAIIKAVLAGTDVFAALPTGGGKSLCYQLPSLVFEGITLVVSPLISLMKDQVDAARGKGLAADFLNSSQDEEEARGVWRGLFGGGVKLLYVSPERLGSEEFRAALGKIGVSFIAVDEAHCISEWGHEFRPDYRTLGTLRKEFPDAVMAAFTATATLEVQKDIIRRLKLKKPLAVRAGFDRPEISYSVVPKSGGEEQVLEFVRSRGGEPGIVYRTSRKSAEETASFLSARGIPALPYHAGLSDDRRRAAQEAFLKDEVRVIAATIAFGMGIDKPNIRWIVHGDLPRSLEAYYQETGRAARDGRPADTVLFHHGGDIAKLRWHIDKIESPEEKEKAEGRLKDVLSYVESSACRRIPLLAHFGEEHPGSCGNCDVCLGRVEMEDLTREARILLSAAARTGEVFGAHHLADIVTGTATDKVLERGHDRLPVYGMGKDRDRSWWLSLLRGLESAGYFRRGEEKLSGLGLTPSGRMLMAGKTVYTAPRRAAAAGKPRTRTAPKPGAAGTASTGKRASRAASIGDASGKAAPRLGKTGEAKLFESLRALRMKLAKQREIPPFMVFSDKTLRAVAAAAPKNLPELLACPGVGPRKAEEYGAEVLRTVREFAGE
jgi:ATP-dependent DNA helicase RecQ